MRDCRRAGRAAPLRAVHLADRRALPWSARAYQNWRVTTALDQLPRLGVGISAEPGSAAPGIEAAQATSSSRTVEFGDAQLLVRELPSGLVCYRVIEASGSSHACRKAVRANEIGYTIAPQVLYRADRLIR